MTMNLHIHTVGEGRPIVLLHGWGMHSGLFEPVVQALQSEYQLHLVDLPGHGESDADPCFADMANFIRQLTDQLTSLNIEKFMLMGWSLGGLIAQAMAIAHPALIEKLVLVTTSPCFQVRDDWACAIRERVLNDFSRDLVADFSATLNRFLALQFMYIEQQKQHLRQAKKLVFSRPEPKVEMLEAGLMLLQNTDLRCDLTKVRCPTLILNAQRDTLVPSLAGRYLAQTIPDARLYLYSGCGHAPFLSHTIQFNQHLKQFLS